MPDPLAGGLPALTLQLAAEIQAGSAAPAGLDRDAKTDVVLSGRRTEQDGVRHHQQSTVRLVPLGPGQRRRVVGVSSRPTGAHRKPTASGRTPRIAPRHTKLENRFLGERPPLWQRQGRTLWIVVFALALTWIVSLVLSAIIE